MWDEVRRIKPRSVKVLRYSNDYWRAETSIKILSVEYIECKYK